MGIRAGAVHLPHRQRWSDGFVEANLRHELSRRFLHGTGSFRRSAPTISVAMAPTNVVDLTAWAEPSNTLVELCDQVAAVFAGTTRRDDPRLVTLATGLMAALSRLENLPPVGGAIGRAVDVLTHVNANNVDDVLDAIRQLRRLSALRATQSPATEPPATEPSRDPGPTDPLTLSSSSPLSSSPDGAVEPRRRRTKHQAAAMPTSASTGVATTPVAATGTAHTSALKAGRRPGVATPTLPGLGP